MALLVARITAQTRYSTVGMTEKMVRRHPHVFGDAVANTPEEVLVHWNAAKAAEKSARTSVLDGVSERMPSLALAQKVLGKASHVGVTADPAAGPRSEAELGEALLALVATARENGWDAERALRERLRALTGEIRTAEAAPAPGESVESGRSGPKPA